MNKPITKVAIAGGLLVVAAAIFLTQAGRADGTKPTAKVEAGAFPSHRSPDEPLEASADGLPEGIAR
jgi:hypothetical protein